MRDGGFQPKSGAPSDGDVESATRIYAASGIGGRVGFGERPGLVVVDLQKGFTDPASVVGGDLTGVVEATAELLDVARRCALPIAYTAVGFHPSHRDGVTWLMKMPGLGSLIEGTVWCEIDDRVPPRADEPLWVKPASSAFFATPLDSFLVGAAVDTLIVAGCVTSGCVRATAIDAVSRGYRVIVPLECVGDRAEAPHTSNLFDIDAKYGDVEPLSRVITAITAPDRAAARVEVE